MLHLLKYDYWGDNNSWYCGDINQIGKLGNQWWLPARLLNLTLEKYVTLLISIFNAQIIGFNKQTLLYKFKSEQDVKSFTSWLNKKAKQANFYI